VLRGGAGLVGISDEGIRVGEKEDVQDSTLS
jgi:hypothetical protein